MCVQAPDARAAVAVAGRLARATGRCRADRGCERCRTGCRGSDADEDRRRSACRVRGDVGSQRALLGEERRRSARRRDATRFRRAGRAEDPRRRRPGARRRPRVRPARRRVGGVLGQDRVRREAGADADADGRRRRARHGARARGRRRELRDRKGWPTGVLGRRRRARPRHADRRASRADAGAGHRSRDVARAARGGARRRQRDDVARRSHSGARGDHRRDRAREHRRCGVCARRQRRRPLRRVGCAVCRAGCTAATTTDEEKSRAVTGRAEVAGRLHPLHRRRHRRRHRRYPRCRFTPKPCTSRSGSARASSTRRSRLSASTRSAPWAGRC